MDINTYMEYKPEVQGFFDVHTNTITYVVADTEKKECIIIDSVLHFDQPSGKISFETADVVIEYIQKKDYTLSYLLETHIHADHISAAPYIQKKLGGTLGIGEQVIAVQKTFGTVFNEGTDFQRDGSQFDVLWKDGDTFSIGEIPAFVMHTPGHTPADMVYIIGDAVFVGDTLFMPDFGTARCDFPGGSAEALYDSVQKIFTLPDDMRMFMCHDYLVESRTTHQWQTSVGQQKKENIHINQKVDKESFIAVRTKRDSGLNMPRLIIPSIQINMNGGVLPKKEENGVAYLKTPINGAFSI